VTDARPEALENLVACCDAIYRSLGEAAPGFGVDACVVRAYEIARAFGELALALRADAGPRPHRAITEVFELARADESGALALHAFSLVGSRLLVTLRDEREADPADIELWAACERIEAVTIAQLLGVARLAAPGEGVEAPGFAEGARQLAEHLERCGNAESFAKSR
jgi:hypothetical protein